MKKLLFSISLIVLLLSQGYSQEKLAQTGFQFLSVSQDARASALGEAYATMENTSGALFYNPAGIARIQKTFEVSANYFNWIAGIQHAALSATFEPSQGEYGVFGFSVQSVDYGNLEGTMVWENEQGYVETPDFNPKAMAVGVAYARSLTDKFVVGGQIKYVGQSLGTSVLPGGITKTNTADGFAFDFGTIYHTGFKSLKIGMFVRNFSQEFKYEQEGFQLPLIFKMGISMDAMDLIAPDQDQHKLLVSFDAAHPRSHREYINLGLEYEFMQTFALRVGYISAQSEQNVTFGVGLHKMGLGLNYAYTPFGVFDSVQRFSVSFSY